MPDLTHEKDRSSLLKAGIKPMAPGTFLAERIIPAKGGVEAAAAAMHMPVGALRDLMTHRQKVNAEIAAKLSRGTGLSVGFWMNLQEASDRLE